MRSDVSLDERATVESPSDLEGSWCALFDSSIESVLRNRVGCDPNDGANGEDDPRAIVGMGADRSGDRHSTFARFEGATVRLDLNDGAVSTRC